MIEPQVSVPIAKAASAADAIAPDPLDEPHVQQPEFHGLCGARVRRRGVAIAHAAGQLDHRRFADQHRAGRIQFFDHRRVVVERLIAKRPRSPRCFIDVPGPRRTVSSTAAAWLAERSLDLAGLSAPNSEARFGRTSSGYFPCLLWPREIRVLS